MGYRESRLVRHDGHAGLLTRSIWVAAIACASAAIVSDARAGSPKVTALLVQQSGIARVVHGSDRKDHIDYDLTIINAFPAPVTLKSIEVMGSDGKVLLRLDGDTLASLTKPLIGGKAGPILAASGVVDTVVDVVVPPGTASPQLTHRINYELPRPHPIAAVIESEVIDGPSVTVDRREPMVIAAPLSGSGWYNANGCCNSGESAHRVARLPVDGTAFKHPETYAIDWLKEVNGRAFSGRGLALADHFAFGAIVKSATSGTVIAARDGLPEQVPMEDARGINESGDYGGNYVVVRVEPNVYAFYAHFQPGSVAVKKGDRVTVGQRLGLLGNSGNSGLPHLHFGLMDGPNWASSDSLPFVIDHWDLAGMSPGDPFDGIHSEGPSGSRSNTYPLITSVATFR